MQKQKESTGRSAITAMHKLSDQVTRKFTDILDLGDEWSIESDTGWQPLVDIKQTVEYEVYRLELSNGMFLECADTHIVFDDAMNEVFVKDLVYGDSIMTEDGPFTVTSMSKLGRSENMYDVGVNSEDHRFFSNGILSHNTTTAAGYLLWRAMFMPDQTILVAAHKYTGAQEIMQRIRYAYESVPNYIRAGAAEYNKGSLTFDNGSRIISATTTENTGRGLSISLIYADEFAFVRNTIAKEFWTSISPTLATGGKAIITSTPNSDEDQFWELWLGANKTIDEYGNQTELGINGFKAFKALWNEHPDRDEKWAQEEMGRVGTDRFLREHNCEPIVFEETLINALHLAKMEVIDPIEKQGQVRWYKKPKKGNTYLLGLDPSLGTGGDPAAIQIYELPSFEQVGEWQHNKTTIQMQVKILKELTSYLYDIVETNNSIYYSVENNTLGEAALVAISEIGEENIHGIFMSEPKRMGAARSFRKGFNTTKTSKLSACAKFKQLIESGKLKIRSKNLWSELKTFVAVGNSFQARVGDTDDLVMATLLVVRMMQNMQDYDQDVDNHMRDLNTDFIAPMPFISVMD